MIVDALKILAGFTYGGLCLGAFISLLVYLSWRNDGEDHITAWGFAAPPLWQAPLVMFVIGLMVMAGAYMACLLFPT